MAIEISKLKSRNQSPMISLQWRYCSGSLFNEQRRNLKNEQVRRENTLGWFNFSLQFVAARLLAEPARHISRLINMWSWSLLSKLCSNQKKVSESGCYLGRSLSGQNSLHPERMVATPFSRKPFSENEFWSSEKDEDIFKAKRLEQHSQMTLLS